MCPFVEKKEKSVVFSLIQCPNPPIIPTPPIIRDSRGQVMKTFTHDVKMSQIFKPFPF